MKRSKKKWADDSVFERVNTRGPEPFETLLSFQQKLLVVIIHSLRRRQLCHGFSQASVQKLEPLIEGQMKSLVDAVDPESGPRLTEQEINSEAFAVL
ncbi:uncharacterized protein N7484_007047 [Penicillium longicatenatum]|uniref:uncharacterized protein n=1 Tax=Penicillium longicatenatum TaxID=1561947 RepID=UPI00254732DE|nr:uncharacterized protein N7484_007047 [Penicillium longicatenatum]KAJ5639185.1 hypothetical protein N7484_007047 [Penicillium longicatenatum]